MCRRVEQGPTQRGGASELKVGGRVKFAKPNKILSSVGDSTMVAIMSHKDVVVSCFLCLLAKHLWFWDRDP